jgi:hypothetical protein
MEASKDGKEGSQTYWIKIKTKKLYAHMRAVTEAEDTS